MAVPGRERPSRWTASISFANPAHSLTMRWTSGDTWCLQSLTLEGTLSLVKHRPLANILSIGQPDAVGLWRLLWLPHGWPPATHIRCMPREFPLRVPIIRSDVRSYPQFMGGCLLPALAMPDTMGPCCDVRPGTACTSMGMLAHPLPTAPSPPPDSRRRSCLPIIDLLPVASSGPRTRQRNPFALSASNVGD